MDDKRLKELFEKMETPEPSDKGRDRALRAAMEAFEAEKEKSTERTKGFGWLARLMGKTEDKGGSPIMNALTFRRLSIAATVAVALIVISVTMSPVFRDAERPQLYTPVAEKTDQLQEGTASIDVSQMPNETEVKHYKAEAPLTRARESSEKRVAEAEPQEFSSPPAAAAGGAESIDKESFMMAEAEMDMAEEGAPAPVMKSEPAPTMMANRGLVAKPEAKKQRSVGYIAQPSTAPVDAIAPTTQEYVGRDSFEHKETNPGKVTREEPVSTFSVDVDTTSYSFVRRMLNDGVLPQKDAVRVEEMINYFDYDYPAPTDRKRPFKASVAVYPTPWNKDTMLLHIGIKGHEIEQTEKPRSNLVFLLDVSGSMKSPDKLPLLKNSMRMLVDTLDAEDTVGIVVYAGAAGAVLEPTPVKEKRKILAALDRLDAGGSTAGGEGLRLAYAMAEEHFDPKAVNRIILATDGDFNVGITNREELKSFIERKRESGIYLSVIGFGQGNYNDSLMQALAQNGNGVAAYIDTLNEARKVLVDEAGSTLYPIATDVKIQVEFNPARVDEYRLIGYETRMLRREDFNNDKVDAGDIGSGHTVTAIYEITPVGSPARMVEDLRYDKEKSVKSDDKSGEYAFLRIRYKLPGEKESNLIERPIGTGEEFLSVQKAPVEMRFASSVAAFGQILKGGRYTGEFTHDDVLALAHSARGEDEFGYRAEFMKLVRLAKSAQAMGAH